MYARKVAAEKARAKWVAPVLDPNFDPLAFILS